MKRRGLILSVLALGVAGFGGAAWYATRPDPIAASDPIDPEMADALIRPYSPILGPEDAPVTIVEFFDPACCHCTLINQILRIGSVFGRFCTLNCNISTGRCVSG